VPCGRVDDACEIDVCTIPEIVNGRYTVVGQGYSHGNQLDTDSIVCNDGYSRTTRVLFTCSCGRDAVPCQTIADACTENVCPVVDVEANRTVAGADCAGGGVVTTAPTCSFDCEPGFYLEGRETIGCSLQGAGFTLLALRS